MKIDFWFDPICPWCWLTSRWLLNEVAPERDLEINWRTISLKFKNNPDESSPFFEPVGHTLGLLRVFTTIKQELGNEAGQNFYTEAGMAIHNNDNKQVTAEELLTAADIDQKFAASYNDETLDAVIQADMDQGLALVGEDVGTPIIGFETASGPKAIFGPVISSVPENLEDSLKLWDSIITIASMDNFWELKRTRTEQPNFNF